MPSDASSVAQALKSRRMGIAQPAVADEREQSVAGVGQFEGPDLVEPRAAQRGIGGGEHQNDSDARSGNDDRGEQLPPQWHGGRRHERTRAG